MTHIKREMILKHKHGDDEDGHSDTQVYEQASSRQGKHLDRPDILMAKKHNQEQHGVWGSVQLKNYATIQKYGQEQNQTEKAMIEFFKKCDEGLQLPYSLLKSIV